MSAVLPQLPAAPITAGPSTAVSTVTQVMATLNDQMNTYLGKLDSTLAALTSLSVPAAGAAPSLAFVRAPDLNWPAPTPLNISDITAISASLPTDPGAASIDTSYTADIPTFSPSISSIEVPVAPAAIDTSGMPDRPAVDFNVDIPSAPALDMPVMDALSAIDIPTFTFPTLPTFSADAPEFTDAAPNVMIEWAEPTYSSENMDLMLETVRRVLEDGGLGIPPVIEAQLWERARSREDRTAAKAVTEAFDTFAAKGFTMPPGMLAQQVNAALENNQMQANMLGREILMKVADVQVENLRFAVQQGLAAENLLVNMFNNAAQRSFEIARFTVESLISLYNAKVSLYNSFVSAYQTRAQVFKIELDAQLAALEAYRIQLEGAKVTSEINQQRVQTFGARIQALMAAVELYRAEMQGAQTKAEVARTQLAGYQTDVQAYAERINAQKVVFDAYRAQVEGEVAKVGIIDAEARVFGSLVSAQQTKAQIWAQGVQAQIAKMQADTQRYEALMDGAKTQIQAKIATVEAQARVAGLEIQNLTAQAEANRAKAEADIRISEEQLQSNIAVANAQIELYKTNQDRALKEAGLKANSLEAAGQMLATLAGGAMAAQHVQASIGASSSDSQSVSWSQSLGESFNHDLS